MSVLSFIRIILVFLLAVLIAVVLGTIVQTQVNLADLSAMGVPVPLDVRLQTTAKDLLGFTPLMTILVGASFLIALPAAELVSRVLKPMRVLVYFLAGAVGIWVAFQAVDWYAPPPVFVAASRDWPGLLAVMAAVGVGSAVFGLITRPKARRGLRVLG